MRKLFFIFYFSLFILISLLSCSEADTDSYCPTWHGFTYTTGDFPNYKQGKSGIPYLNPGDSIHITAHQDERGQLINSTDYVWTLCYDTLDTKDTDDPDDDEIVHVQKSVPASDLYPGAHTNYDGYANGSDDPVAHIHIPANTLRTTATQLDTIKFVAYYSYSGQGRTIETGTIAENTSSYYNGRITPQSGPFGGGATGYFYFRVQ